MPGLDQLIHDGARQVDRNGEAVARVESRLARDRRIDADHLAPDVHQGPARVAGIDPGVALDDVLDRVARVLQARDQATFRHDDAGGPSYVEHLRTHAA